MDWRVAQMVECLICKHEALSSNNKKKTPKNLFLFFLVVFLVTGLTFEPLIHFELIFVCSIK
jgi:hypothetical protein